MCLVRSASLEIIAANNAAACLYGYARQELPGLTLFDLCEAAEHERLFAITGALPGMGIQCGIWSHRRKDGGRLLVRSAWSMFGKGDEMLWTLEDQSPVAAARAAALESARALDGLLENSPQALCRYSFSSGAVEYANRVLLTVCGLSEIEAAKLYQRYALKNRFVDASDAERFANSVGLTAAFRQQAQWRGYDGALRTISIYGFPIVTDAIDRIVSLEDVTARQSLEQSTAQREKMEALGRVAATVAHDFNNILLVMRGYAEMLNRTLPPSSMEGRHAAALLAAADSASEVTAALVGFAGRHVESPERLDLNDLVREMANSFFPTLPERINGRVTLSDKPLAIMAERSKMQRMLLNLAANARDAMPGGGMLTISTQFRGGPDAAQSECSVEVRDTGVGMDETTRTRIFERFFTTKGAGRGTGLGLAFVETAMSQIGGRVEVESELGQGSCFRLVFARESAETPKTASPARSSDRATILLVDDDEHIRRLVADFLNLLNYEVIAFPSAAEAMDKLSQDGQIDLILSDVTMAGISGQALAERARALRPGIPVLLMSGRSETSQLTGAGFRVIVKPFSIREIQAQVELALQPDRCATVGQLR